MVSSSQEGQYKQKSKIKQTYQKTVKKVHEHVARKWNSRIHYIMSRNSLTRKFFLEIHIWMLTMELLSLTPYLFIVLGRPLGQSQSSKCDISSTNKRQNSSVKIGKV